MSSYPEFSRDAAQQGDALAPPRPALAPASESAGAAAATGQHVPDTIDGPFRQIGAAAADGMVAVADAPLDEPISISAAWARSDAASAFRDVHPVAFGDPAVRDGRDLLAMAGAPTAGDDDITGTEDADTIDGLGGNDTIQGLGGDDLLSGGAGNDVLAGGAGDDTLDGGAGDDLYVFHPGDGADVIAAQQDTDPARFEILQFDGGILPGDVTAMRLGDDLILAVGAGGDRVTVERFFDPDPAWHGLQLVTFAASGTQWTRADLVTAPYFGTEAADTMTGTDADDAMYGLGGDDLLSGGAGNDVLEGGAGDDTLDGGAGDDLYVFGPGDGADVIAAQQDTDPARFEILQFDGGILPGDVTAIRLGDDLILAVGAGGDRVTVERFFDPDPAWHGLQAVTFAASGTQWTRADLVTAPFYGTEGADTMTGTDADDAMFGLGGDDLLSGGAGNDVLEGGAGNDTLDGGAGDDLYVFSPGDGADVIAAQQDTDPARFEILQFEGGILPGDVSMQRLGDDLILTVGAGGDRVTVERFFDPDPAWHGLQAVTFAASGTQWTRADLVTAPWFGTEAADTMTGTDADDAMFGLGGDDLLSGGAGNDTLDGGAGNDTLDGGAGDDLYVFGPGDGADVIAAQQDTDPARFEILQFDGGILPGDVTAMRLGDDLILAVGAGGDRVTVERFFDPDPAWHGLQLVTFAASGTQWTRADLVTAPWFGTEAADTMTGTDADDDMFGLGGDDLLSGGAGNDVLEGGAGDDTLDGGAGDDLYVFHPGDGADVIAAQQDTDPARFEILQFDGGILPGDVTAMRLGDDLILAVGAGGDRVTVERFFDPDPAWHGLQLVTFAASGTQWTRADLVTAPYFGTEAADTMTGTDADDDMFGLGGDDLLSGGAGNDVLAGGAGDDTLDGGAGDDLYVFGPGDGADVIAAQQDTDPARFEILQFEGGILPGDVTAIRLGDDLILAVGAGGDRVTVERFFDPDPAWHGLQAVTFAASGTQWTRADLVTAPFYGTEGADTMTGTDADDAMFGLGGDDLLSGGAGNDVLAGGAGNDTLDGGAGDDLYVFSPGDGADVIAAQQDTDPARFEILQFEGGILPGDVSMQRLGDDLILAVGAGGDRVTVERFFDPDPAWHGLQAVTFAASGTQWTRADLVTAPYFGTEGADTMTGTDADDAMFGLGGDDLLSGGAGNDTLDGGAGDDTLDGGAGDDLYVFGPGDGADVIAAQQDTDPARFEILQFEGGILPGDVTAIRLGDDLILAVGAGGDRVTVERFFDPDPAWHGLQAVTFAASGTQWTRADLVTAPFYGTEGADTMTGTDADDAMFGLGGDDLLSGGAGNDVLAGGAGNDTLDGGAGDDLYVFSPGDGADVIAAQQDTDPARFEILQFEGGILPGDVSMQRLGDDLILAVGAGGDRVTVERFFDPDPAWHGLQAVTFAASGTQWTRADLVTAPYFGTEGADTMTGTDADDAMFGLGGDDLLSGGAGNDTLDGGAGDDTLDGGAGDDVYVFAPGDGHDRILAADDANPDKHNVLEFAAAILTGDVVVRRSGSDLVLSLGGGVDSVTVADFFHALAWERCELQEVRFADGTVWTPADLTAMSFAGTEGPDALFGSDGADTIDALGGDDLVHGNGGDDAIDGGSGDDFLDGGSGADTLMGGDGADQLFGGSGDDLLEGGAGDDTLIGNDGADTLDGGAGDDFLVTTAGDTTIRFDLGGGADVIQPDPEAAPDQQVVLVFGAGIAPGDIVHSRDGADLILAVAGTDDSVTVRDFFLWGAEAQPLDAVQFADGTVWSGLDILPLVPAASASAGADWVTVDGTFDGRGGDDVLYGGAAADVLKGGDGADVLSGGAGDDMLDGSDGDDILHGGAGDEWLFGGRDDDVLSGGAGDDRLLAGSGNDILEGGAGNDRLRGGKGDDIYRFGIGDGHDTIEAEADTWVYRHNVLEFGEGIAPGDVDVARGMRDGVWNLDLELRLASGDRVTVERFYEPDWNQSYQEIQAIRFADGTEWDRAMLLDLRWADPVADGTEGDDAIEGDAADNIFYGHGGADLLDGNAGADTLYGGAGDDRLHGGFDGDALFGGDGNDRLYGVQDDDTLDGGAGDDFLNGGIGSDTYRWGAGGGADRIWWTYDAAAGKHNVLEITGGSLPGDLTSARSGEDLILTLATGETLTVPRFFHDDAGYHEVQEVHFADGTVWDRDDLIAVAAGVAPASVMQADMADGTATFHYALAAITDVVLPASMPEPGGVLAFGAGIAAADVTRGRDGADLVFTVAGTDDSVTVTDFFLWETAPLDAVHFADGTVWTGLDMLQLEPLSRGFYGTHGKDWMAVDGLFSGMDGDDVAYGGEGRDRLNGGTGDDVLNGGGGQDLLRGDAGNDILQGGAGMDRLFGDDGDDWLLGGAGDDRLHGGAGRDHLAGGAGDDRMAGRAGDDSLTGGAGDDALAGGAGADRLAGGAGDDRLSGGAGDDTYLFDRGDGADQILGARDGRADKANALVFGNGVTPEALSAARDGDSLVLSVGGAADRVVVERFFDADAAWHEVQAVRFADGTEWDRGDLLALVEAPAGPALAARSVLDPVPEKAVAGKAGLVCDISADRATADAIDQAIAADALRFLPMDASPQAAVLAAAMAETLAPFDPTAPEAGHGAALVGLAADVPVEPEAPAELTVWAALFETEWRDGF